MKKIEGYDEAQALTGEYERLEAGGYICKIINAKEEESKSGKRMLVIAIDIAEGEHKGYYQKRYDESLKNASPDKHVKWAGVYRQMLEGENSAGFLKGLITSLEASNEGFKWNWDEKKLIGLKCGAIFGEEEYEKMDGNIGTTVKVKYIRSVKSIQDGKFEIPKIKKLPKRGDAFDSFDVTSDTDDLPF